MPQKITRWTSSSEALTKGEEQALAYSPCTFNPQGVTVADCKRLSGLVANKERCRGCLSAYNHVDGNNPRGTKDVFTDLSTPLLPFARRISAAPAPRAAPVALVTDKTKNSEAVRIAAMIAELDRQGRPPMEVHNVVMRLKREFMRSHARIAKLLGLTPVDVGRYRSLEYLVPEVQAQVRELGLKTVCNISFARRELQSALADRVSAGQISPEKLVLLVHSPGVRDSSRRGSYHRNWD